MSVGELMDILKLLPHDKPVCLDYDGLVRLITTTKIVNGLSTVWICCDEPDRDERGLYWMLHEKWPEDD